MAIITVVGAGVMGSALTFPLSDNGHQVRLVGTHLDNEIIGSCLDRRYHPRLKRQIAENVTPYYSHDLAEAMRGAEVIVLGVNSRGVHWAAEHIGSHLVPGQIIHMVTKGMETIDGKLTILPDVVHDNLPESIRDQVHYSAIGGPCIAGELAARHHSAVVYCSRNSEILPRLRSYFSTPYYHIWTSTDLVGVEVCVALKNPYALAAGLAAGVLEKQGGADESGAQMHNYAAAIFAQGLAETAIIVKALGGGMETVYSLPGAGDLFVTTQGGRNSRMGRLLGMGLAYSDAVEEMPNETIEGVDAVVSIMPGVKAMMDRGEISADSVPLLTEMHRILTRNQPIDFDFNSFFSKLPFTPPEPSKA